MAYKENMIFLTGVYHESSNIKPQSMIQNRRKTHIMKTYSYLLVNEFVKLFRLQLGIGLRNIMTNTSFHQSDICLYLI